MTHYTSTDLYLAFRQAKIAQFFEHRGTGLIEFSRFEAELPSELERVAGVVASKTWFDAVGWELGDVFIVPKRLDPPTQDEDLLSHIGPGEGPIPQGMDVQFRLSPSPTLSILEILFLWKFGPGLDRLLSSNVEGNRLDLRRGRIRPHGRWVYKYWPAAYKRFRDAPLRAAKSALLDGNRRINILSADLASFYDTVNPDFLLSEHLQRLLKLGDLQLSRVLSFCV